MPRIMPDKVRELGENIAERSIEQWIVAALRLITPTLLAFLLYSAASIHSDLTVLHTQVAIMIENNKTLNARLLVLEGDARPLGGILARMQSELAEIRIRVDQQRQDLDKLRDALQ